MGQQGRVSTRSQNHLRRLASAGGDATRIRTTTPAPTATAAAPAAAVVAAPATVSATVNTRSHQRDVDLALCNSPFEQHHEHLPSTRTTHSRNNNRSSSSNTNHEPQGSMITSTMTPLRSDVSKNSLQFILDDDHHDAFQAPASTPEPPRPVEAVPDHRETMRRLAIHQLLHHPTEAERPLDASPAATAAVAPLPSGPRATLSKPRKTVKSRRVPPPADPSHHQHLLMAVPVKRTERKRKARRRPPSRICKFEGCEQYVVDQGLCVRHGGGKRCQTEGCTSRAKHQGKCWKHGGSTGCKVPDCLNRAKSRGYCWSHGGGTKCKAATCEKIAISNGLCWAHGGGKRCIVDGCRRQAYERTLNYCNHHYQEIYGAVVGEGDAETSTDPEREEKGGEESPASDVHMSEDDMNSSHEQATMAA